MATMLEEMVHGGSSPRLSERRLSYLFAAVEAKSIRGAADKLDIEPSVVSRQIQLLERELETTLLDRHGRGVAATETAQVVLDYYRRHVVEEAAMLSQLEDLKGLKRGDVQIATSEGFIEDLVEVTLPEFYRSYPNIKVTLNSTPAARLLRLIGEERVSIGLAFAPRPDNHVEVFARKRHPLFIIARHDHPIARERGLLTLGAVAHLPFSLVPEEFGVGQLVKLAEQSAEVTLKRAMVTNSLHALRHFVTAGLGLTILPKILVRHELAAGSVKAVRVKNVSLEAAEAQIIVPKRPIRSVAESAMLERLVSLSWFTG